MTLRLNREVPARALAIGAHPDDIEFGCGATLAKWAALGCDVHLLVLTDGSKGTWSPDEDLAALVTTRQGEQRAAAAALGAREVHFLDVVDGELTADRVVEGRVCATIRNIRPDVVFGHDPWKRGRLHPDHRQAGWLTLGAVVAARDPHFFPEQPDPPYRPALVALFEPEHVDYIETLEPSHIDAKIKALLCHRSQWRSTMGIDERPEEQQAAFERSLRDEAAADGLRAGARFAEAFSAIADV